MASLSKKMRLLLDVSLPLQSATISFMRRASFVFLLTLFCSLGPPQSLHAQSATGALDFSARITPTAARPEPVRQFTFYILTKSYGEIAKEVEDKDITPTREAFIDDLKVSAELKAWLKAHDIMDLTLPSIDKLLTPDDILHTPEFLLAYQRANSGGVASGIPKPKYVDADKTERPERYEKQKQEYMTALKKFIQYHPETVAGMELELDGVNPQRNWALMRSNHKKRVQRLAPDFAQTHYLVGKVDTDLDGRAILTGLLPGNYWISSLNLEANAGDTRLRWDVAVSIRAGQTARVELTNLNATDTQAASAP